MEDSDQEVIQQFVNITGSNETVAKQYLSSVSNVLDEAVQLYYATEQQTGQSNNSSPSPFTEPEIRQPDESTTEQLMPSYESNIPHMMFQERYVLPDVQLATPDYLNEHKSFNEICEQAKQEHKSLLVCLTSNSVLKGIHLNRDLWCNEEIYDLIKDNIICWQVNCEHPEGQQFCRHYNIIGETCPQICILENETKQEIHRIKSLSDCGDFIIELMDVIDAYKTKYEEPVKKEIIIPDEPDKSNVNSYIIKYTFSDNSKSMIRRFLKTESIQLVYDFIESSGYNDFDIFNSYPKKSLKSDCKKTLEECNLKNCILNVQIN